MNGIEIKKIRKNLGLSQLEFGELIGVSRDTIYNYENGGKIPESKRKILKSLIDSHQLQNITKEEERYKSINDDILSMITSLHKKNEALELENKMLRNRINELEKK